MRIRACIAAAALIALSVDVAAAQEAADTVRLPELIVTATRVPMPRDAVPAAVTVITGAELRARGVAFVAEALREVPGVWVVQTGPAGSLASLFMRGGEADYVKVLVDGVPLNAPGGAVDLSELTTDDVERIEIVRGPVSVLYGSDAVSGVVQIFTHRGARGTRLSGTARAGNRGTTDAELGLRGSGERASWSLGAARYATDGVYEFNNEYENTLLSAGARLARSRFDADVGVRYGDGEYHYPTEGTGVPVDRNAFQRNRRLTVSVDAGVLATERLDVRLLLTENRLDSRIDDAPDAPGDTLGFYASRSDQELLRRGADARANLRLPLGVVLTLGGVLERQQEESRNESQSQFGPSTGSFDADRTNRAVYLQALAAPSERVSATAGIRRDDNDAFGGHTTYRLGAAARPAGSLRLRAAYGTAFKEPTFFENFAQVFARGNPDLEPETSRSWEIGAEQSAVDGRLAFGATWFAQRFENLIQYTFTTPTPDAPNYYNVVEARADGLELTASLEPHRVVSLRGSYTWLDSEATDPGYQQGDDAEFVRGDRLLRRPTHSGSIGVLLRPRAAASAGVTVLFVGERDDLDFSGFPARRVTLDGYARVDASAEWRVAHVGARLPLAVTGRVENLFGAEYEEVVSFPARGRLFLVGVRAGH